ncbi:hypothetical protein IV38_GL001868 [Lactobacillus selangorensis]|uniref:YxjI protein n=1 Tax=Lactobacillus selangorensis TaxID=81857 RepID=A0A0R2FGH0_9LACO|nr:hypothetical protein [Lactobacillus selangorensis]KRN27656.1 hypothetical protein IV38_GL001868 [Lactobacillus selangorensis]KRN30377.1 hypothetical protein IV40_GL001966 [Lactobacillus selangorensis]
MQFVIREPERHLNGVTFIYDAHKRMQYLLVGNRGLRHNKISLYASSGELLGEIQQMSLGFSPRYDLWIDQQKVASLKKLFGMWREFTFVSGYNWLIVGDLVHNQYRILHHTSTLMTAQSILLPTGNGMALEITHDSDIVPCLLISAVLNHWARTKQKDRRPIWGSPVGMPMIP